LTGFPSGAGGRESGRLFRKPDPPIASALGSDKERTFAAMPYQLVLQFQGRDVDDFEDLIHLEDTLIAHLDERHRVDGHDFGADTMNIYIHTDSPQSAFDKIKELVHHSLLDKTKAAYRRSGENDFTVIWPEKNAGRFEI
jgi:hypothetical protein